MVPQESRQKESQSQPQGAERSAHGQDQQHREGLTKLFVGGLAWQCTEDTLRKAFGAHGEVTKAEVKMDRFEPTKSRGFGFVHVSCLPRLPVHCLR